MVVLIDNGHGQDTPGKRSPDGKFREYSWTREIAERIVSGLKSMGYDAERIVTEQTDISLQERCRRVNEFCGRLGKENIILVSVHVNAAGNGSAWMAARGWSAYTSKGKTKADGLASCLYEAAKSCLPSEIKIRTDYSDGDADWEEGFYILNKTQCPTVLTENLFQDNKDDVEYLLSEKGKQTIVQTHIDGIIKYINKA